MELINLEKALLLREELRKEGKVLPASKDIIFKNVMKNCPNYLSRILSYFVDYDKETIKKNMYLENVEFSLSNFKEKNKTADIIVRIGNNVINLEMNYKSYKGLRDRNVSYISKAKAEASFTGEEYVIVYKAIQINFDLEWEYDDREIIKFLIADIERGLIETDNYQIYHINLSKLKEKYYNNVELDEFERAITLLTLDKKDDIEKISRGDESLMEAKEEIEKLSDNLGVIGVYDYQKYKEWEWKQLAEKSLEDKINAFNSDKEKFENDKKNFENERNSFNNIKDAFNNEKSAFNNEKDAFNNEKDAFNNKISLFTKEKELLKKEQDSLKEKLEEFNKDKKKMEQEKEKMIRNLFSMNLNLDDVIKITGLTKEEINKLQFESE